MVRSQRLRSLVRSTPLLLMLGVGGVVTALGISSPGLSLPSASGGSIHDSPKEVIDQVWQIVYRDYLDSTGSYDERTWRQLRSNLLRKSYGGSAESYEAIRGMLASLDDPYTLSLIHI